MENLRDKIYHGKATRADITRLTRRLGDEIAAVYGFDIPKQRTPQERGARYGFGSRVEWCACFVSWCADQCGYIDTGVVPKYAGCVNGVQWFKDRGQWIDGSAEPVPGMIIFFDWDNKGSSGPQDGQSDHTGIVQKVENGIVYTVEGNSGDSCRVNQYSVGHYEILGYGVPQY